MPPLHSIITMDNNEVSLEAIAPAPQLVVNGRVVREAQLADGDVIGIGQVELLACISAGHSPANIQLSDSAILHGDVEPSPSELSAAELVDRIEAEDRLVEDFEERRRSGARALARIVRQKAPSEGAERETQRIPPRAIPAPHFLSKRPQVLAARGRAAEVVAPRADDANSLAELEQLGRQLTELSNEIQASARRAAQRETIYRDASDVLLETQLKLASQLETLVTQVSEIQQAASTPKSRAIA